MSARHSASLPVCAWRHFLSKDRHADRIIIRAHSEQCSPRGGPSAGRVDDRRDGLDGFPATLRRAGGAVRLRAAVSARRAQRLGGRVPRRRGVTGEVLGRRHVHGPGPSRARVSLDPARANTFTMVSTDDAGVSRTKSFALDDPESLREEARERAGSGATSRELRGRSFDPRNTATRYPARPSARASPRVWGGCRPARAYGWTTTKPPCPSRRV